MAAATREVHDHYFRKAKSEGYAARSAYKLIEIQEKKRIIKPRSRVLDLGCAPGAWLQVACEALGPRRKGGLVVGIDLKPVRKQSRHWDDRIFTHEGDALDPNVTECLSKCAGPEPFDVVLSDMMGSTSGHQATDHLRSAVLARRALEIACLVLRGGGFFVVKIFEGEQYPAFIDECRACFQRVKGYRPKASRGESTEMFVIGEGFRGNGV